MAGKLFPISSQPGIKRDGTEFLSQYYTAGSWCRFYRGLPRKMGGYKQLIGGLPNIPRGVFVFPQTPNFVVYIGDFQSLKYFVMDENGNRLSALIDVTPVGFIPDINNDWQFDVMFSATSDANVLIAHAAPNIGSITNNIERPIFYGPIGGVAPLVPTGQSVSGGITVLHPFLFMLSNDGEVRISNANDPTTLLLASARIAAQKCVRALPTRGGNSSPAGLIWTLDSLIRVTRPTAAGDFRFDTVTSQSSILSSDSVIEAEGKYYWAGTDRFLMYNGSVSELPNQLNLNYFFLNLNYAQRQKVWATKNSQFGEIWWHFPMGNSVECNHAVIYNIRENTWYDTPIGRSKGYFEQVFSDPVWADTSDGFGNYAVWQQETGVDQNIGGVLTPIFSSFTTGDISFIALGPTGSWVGDDRRTNLYRVELDMTQIGEMTMTVNEKAYARSNNVASITYPFLPTDLKIDTREEGRIMSFSFESNIVGGFYELGQMLLYLRQGDTRP